LTALLAAGERVVLAALDPAVLGGELAVGVVDVALVVSGRRDP
jgi:hypothetical protein